MPALLELKSGLAGRYRLERELGSGGMATVYLAHDLRHDRPVALKVLRPELAASLGPERFKREIHTAASLQHPHILSVHDSGETAGQLWFTMPFVEGESLRDRLTREKQLPLDDALHIARNVMSALACAHDHGIIHRDIKPENILITSGDAMVADFGIARGFGGADDNLTGTGLAIGTAAYMSPEQAAADRELDGRTDVYAMGCVLYEMLAGEPPYTGPSAGAILVRALTETPRPIHPIRNGVPAALDRVIAKAMAATPADRFATMMEFGRALELAALAPAVSQDSPAASWGRSVAGHRLVRRPLVAAVVLGLLVLAGVFVWRGAHQSGEGTGPKRLAVLPFENLGASDDEYFADGVTDAVRGKLAALPGLQVTARGSSSPYKHTTKTLRQIGQELGVGYLLTGTVRWDKQAGQPNRVQVAPELIQVATGAAQWQQPFDAVLSDVFQLQADIAGQVARALDVALGTTERRTLAQRPTAVLAAYDAFLRGEAASEGIGVADPSSLRRAIGYYEQAVALDSTFVDAWVQLSEASSTLYFNGTGDPEAAQRARGAADRALTLAPKRPEGYLALADYYSLVVGDFAQARASAAEGQAKGPASAELLVAVARAEMSLGQWEEALGHLEQAWALNPRSILVARRLAQTMLWLRRYPEARAAADRGLLLATSNLFLLDLKAMAAVGEGDLSMARAVLAAAPPEVEPTALVAFAANYWGGGWILSEVQQALLLRLGPIAFDDARADWALALASAHHLRGDVARARAYGDTAQRAYVEQMRRANGPRAQPASGTAHTLRGLALAYAGRKAEAVAEGERGGGLLPLSRDAFAGAYNLHEQARLYAVVGEPDRAVDRLEQLLGVPYFISVAWLRIDPNFATLQGNARFQRLVAAGRESPKGQ